MKKLLLTAVVALSALAVYAVDPDPCGKCGKETCTTACADEKAEAKAGATTVKPAEAPKAVAKGEAKPAQCTPKAAVAGDAKPAGCAPKAEGAACCAKKGAAKAEVTDEKKAEAKEEVKK